MCDQTISDSDIQLRDSYSSPDSEVPLGACSDAMELDDNSYSPQLSDLPEEILERILSFVSRYKDSDSAKLVCVQWHRVINSLVKQSKRLFNQRLGSCKVGWTEIIQGQGSKSKSADTCFRVLSISERFSHSCAYLNGSMFVFGGCTSTNTTFNDLWRLDLSTRRWMRPVAMGSYPSPKACATMVVYKGKLVLFGGWSHPIPYPLHQSANYFSELHIYDPATNRWSLILSIGPEPDALGGHSASIIQNLMVVFGGSPRPGQGSNKLWVYDFVRSVWSNPKVKTGVCPEPRYGQFQCTLDETHILVMGGCGGPNKFFNDFYILTVDSVNAWHWTKLEVQHPEFAPRQTWCHAVCKVDNKIVVLCKSSKQRESLNTKPRVCRVEGLPKPSTPSTGHRNTLSQSLSSPSSLPQTSDGQQSSPEKHYPVAKAKSEESGSDFNSPAELPAAEGTESHPIPSPHNRNLLALQQRLHRDCAKLTDQDSHQHNSQPENNIPEGQIHRLQNKANQYEEVNHQPNHHHHHRDHSQFPQEPNQPHAGQFRPRVAVREGVPMPSIRPNAKNNRQKQLEALQRQEELLRSKSKALAAAREQKRHELESPTDCSMEDDDFVPTTVSVKNRMDVHVVDIASALTSGQVEWKPESLLQPVGAPFETLCCSLVEGRAELILFGGVGRETTIPMIQNTGLNRLYILHS